MERRISETEREVLRLLGQGHAPREIARRLGISETTVTWMVANIVSEWGARRTDDFARVLASAHRGRWVAQFALPLAAMGVLTLATAVVLSTTGTLHGPLGSPSVTPSATSFGGSGPKTSPESVPPAADGAGATVAPTPAPVAPTQFPVVPTLGPPLPTPAPVVPTLPPVIPTIAPTAAPSLPLPPLPTVPPLPTPHLPSL